MSACPGPCYGAAWLMLMLTLAAAAIWRARRESLMSKSAACMPFRPALSQRLNLIYSTKKDLCVQRMLKYLFVKARIG